MYLMVKTVSLLVVGLFSALVNSRPQLRAEDLEPFLDNPEALKEFGQLIAAEIRFVLFLFIFICISVWEMIKISGLKQGSVLQSAV